MTPPELVMVALGLAPKIKAKRIWAICPLARHEHDRADHFFVRPASSDKPGQWWCFACHRGGGLVSLVITMKGLDPGRENDVKIAIEFVKSCGASYRPPPVSAAVVRQPAVFGKPRFRLPYGVCLDPLEKWIRPARNYAASRGITAEEVDLYGLGYAVDGRLEGRIVFPTREAPSGRPVDYSARTFTEQERRYLTPHESEGAEIDTFFGQHLWPGPGERRQDVIVVEGVLKKLAVSRVVDTPCGSLSGSHVRAGHLEILTTFKRVIAMTDGDASGESAAAQLRAGMGRGTKYARLALPVVVGRDGKPNALGADDLSAEELARFLSKVPPLAP